MAILWFNSSGLGEKVTPSVTWFKNKRRILSYLFNGESKDEEQKRNKFSFGD